MQQTIARNPSESINDQRIKYYLEIWREWMLKDDTHLGYPKKSLCMMTGGLSSFDDLADQVDYTDALAMDAIISHLSMSQQIAINHFHLAAVWKSSRQILEEVYADALKAIERGLNLKGMI